MHYNKTHLILILFATQLFFKFGGGCQEMEPPPLNLPDGYWEVGWSYTSGNELVGGNPGSHSNQWKNTFSEGTNYNFKPQRWDPENMPSDAGWDYQNLAINIQSFLQEFYDIEHINSVPADYVSYLFGVNTPSNTPADVYGRTFPKGSIIGVHGVAVSLVFKSKIHAIPNTTTEQRWRLTEYSIIHELGHARGLNTAIDHDTHSGSNQDICIMRFAILELLPSTHVFCGYHKRVLKQCLPTIQFTYNPNADCALFDQ